LRQGTRVARSTTFLVRSFLYLGYGDVSGLVFVPDAVRVPVVGQVVGAERELRDRPLQTMIDAVSPRMLRKGIMLERVSPLAAVVFGRAQPDQKRIVPELKTLREELAPLRQRLREAEQKIFFGHGDEVVDATDDWNQINHEVKRSFGKEPHLVSVDQVLSFGQDVGEAAADPTKPKGWTKALMGLPADVVCRKLLRRKAVELHRLRNEVPAVGTLQNAIAALFGSRIVG
jgi:hypothetical protein